MNIEINNDESFRKEMMSVINNLSERMSFIEDVILSENEDPVDDLNDEENEDHVEDLNDEESEDCCEERIKGYNLNEHLVSDLITSMRRLREYDLQKHNEYYDYLEEDDDIISDLNSAYYYE